MKLFCFEVKIKRGKAASSQKETTTKWPFLNENKKKTKVPRRENNIKTSVASFKMEKKVKK